MLIACAELAFDMTNHVFCCIITSIIATRGKKNHLRAYVATLESLVQSWAHVSVCVEFHTFSLCQRGFLFSSNLSESHQ